MTGRYFHNARFYKINPVSRPSGPNDFLVCPIGLLLGNFLQIPQFCRI